jgi:hypothetical protein
MLALMAGLKKHPDLEQSQHCANLLQSCDQRLGLIEIALVLRPFQPENHRDLVRLADTFNSGLDDPGIGIVDIEEVVSLCAQLRVDLIVHKDLE